VHRRALEVEGFVHREVYLQLPAELKYSRRKSGKRAIQNINVIRNYGL
jgi:DNA-binding HxlR family transcriptional regulator